MSIAPYISPTAFDWNADNVALLKKLWNDGLTADAISTQLPGASRNAVIGKLHRLKLKPGRRARGPNKLQAGTGQRVVNHGNRLDVVEDNAPALPTLADGSDIPIEQRRTLLNVGSEECHWPFGDPAHKDFFYCGADVCSGHNYCAYHARLAGGGTPKNVRRQPDFRPYHR